MHDTSEQPTNSAVLLLPSLLPLLLLPLLHLPVYTPVTCRAGTMVCCLCCTAEQPADRCEGVAAPSLRVQAAKTTIYITASLSDVYKGTWTQDPVTGGAVQQGFRPAFTD